MYFFMEGRERYKFLIEVPNNVIKNRVTGKCSIGNDYNRKI
jgi:hypothetical protein